MLSLVSKSDQSWSGLYLFVGRMRRQVSDSLCHLLHEPELTKQLSPRPVQPKVSDGVICLRTARVRKAKTCAHVLMGVHDQLHSNGTSRDVL